MLIYYKKDEKIYVSQVTISLPKFQTTAVVKDIDNLPKQHQPYVRQIEKAEDQIFVSGNSTVIGNGIFLDNLFTEYTGVKSKHPEIFVPLNPDFTPGRDKIESKYHQEWVSYVGRLQKERSEAIQAGKTPMSLDEIDDLSEEKDRELKEKKQKEIDALKSYKELGVIVEPTKIKEFDPDNGILYIESSEEMNDLTPCSINPRR